MDEYSLKQITTLCAVCGYWKNSFGIDKCFCPESDCDHSWLDTVSPNLIDSGITPKKPGDVWVGTDCLMVKCICGGIMELRSEVFGF